MAAATTLPAPPKVVVSDYEGFGPTIKQVAVYIREFGDSPDFQRFANAIVDRSYPRSQHTTNAQVAQCLLDYMNKNVRFRPDPPNTERVTSPRLLLCTSGEGAACVPVEDCESTLCAYLTLCRAMGIDGQILLQELLQPNGEKEWHMAGTIRLEDGSWIKVDPSLKGSSRIGQAQTALQEQVIDPLDPKWSGAAGGAKFVTIGARPTEKPMFSFRPAFPAMIGHQAMLGPMGHDWSLKSKKPCCAKCAGKSIDARTKQGPPGNPPRPQPPPPPAGVPRVDALGRMVVQKMEANDLPEDDFYGDAWRRRF